jgi:hypothetical protein
MEAARIAKVELENKMLDLKVPQDSEFGRTGGACPRPGMGTGIEAVGA